MRKKNLGMMLAVVLTSVFLFTSCAILYGAMAEDSSVYTTPEVIIERSRVMVAQEQYTRAISLLERAVSQKPRNKPLAEELAKVKQEYAEVQRVAAEQQRIASEQAEQKRLEREEQQRIAAEQRNVQQQKAQEVAEQRAAQRRQQQIAENNKIKEVVRLNGSYICRETDSFSRALRFIETPYNEKNNTGGDIVCIMITFSSQNGWQSHYPRVSLTEDNNISFPINYYTWTIRRNGELLNSTIADSQGRPQLSYSYSFTFRPSSSSISNRQYSRIDAKRASRNAMLAFAFYNNQWAYETANGITTKIDGSPLPFTYSNGKVVLYIDKAEFTQLYEIGDFLFNDGGGSIYQLDR